MANNQSKSSQGSHQKIKRIDYVGVTGGTKICPTSDLEVILRILKKNDFKPGELNGHLKILEEMHKEEIWSTNS